MHAGAVHLPLYLCTLAPRRTTCLLGVPGRDCAIGTAPGLGRGMALKYGAAPAARQLLGVGSGMRLALDGGCSLEACGVSTV